MGGFVRKTSLSSPYVAWRLDASRMASAGFGRESILAAIEAMKAGKMVVVTDDESRENEGDFIMAGEFATPETIGFIVRYSSGVICCAVSMQCALFQRHTRMLS